MSIVLVSTTDTLLSFLQETSPKDAALAESAKQVDLDIVFDAIEKAKNSNENGAPPSLDKLLAGCEVVARKEKKEDLTHLSEIEILRLKAEEKKYQRSVALVRPWQRNISAREDLKEASSSMAFAAQFILSFVGAFLLGYYFCETFIIDDLALKTMAGGLISFATLILESFLFILRDSKERMIKDKKDWQNDKYGQALHTAKKMAMEKAVVPPTDPAEKKKE